MSKFRDLIENSRNNVRIVPEDGGNSRSYDVNKDFGSKPSLEPSPNQRDSSGWDGKLTPAMLSSIDINVNERGFTRKDFSLERPKYWDHTPRKINTFTILGEELIRRATG